MFFKKLKNYFGYGKTKSFFTLYRLGFNPSKTQKKLKSKNFFFKDIVIVNYLFLKKQKFEKLKTEKILNSYKGLRFKKNLPVNGQRTKTNAKTRKKFKII